jgi:hypothetical protein
MQYFKGDERELKFDAAGEVILSNRLTEKEAFFDGAFTAAPLGDVIFDNLLSPLSNAIDRDIFRLAFPEIFEAFVSVGTFEAYLTVFRKIFGEDVDVQFTVPAPGKLNIDITAQGLELSEFVARYIDDNTYFFDNVVDDVADQIVFRTVLGFVSQYELEQMLFEMVPAGIYTEITLDI